MKLLFWLLLFSLFLVFMCGFKLPKGTKKAKKISQIELGKQLFFDPILSADSSVSCASCHKPEFYFADNVSFSIGIGGKLTKRNSPSVLNMASRDLMFWDGRAKSLEDQVLFPIRDHNEMSMLSHDAIGKLKKSKKYKKWFMEVFGKYPDEKLLSQAIASFEATLETSNSKFDKANKGELKLTADELAGKKLFVGKGKCFDCHFSPDFTGDEFKNIGLYDGEKWNDRGRFEITKDSSDLGKFKVPGLRNVAKTAPYMHNGSFKNLREVIDYYVDPQKVIPNAIGTDSTIAKGLVLSELEKIQLEAFINTLTDETIFKTFKSEK